MRVSEYYWWYMYRLPINIFVQNILEHTYRQVVEIMKKVVKKRHSFLSKKSIFCQFFRERAECCLTKIISSSDICKYTSLKSWPNSWRFHMVEKCSKIYFHMSSKKTTFLLITFERNTCRPSPIASNISTCYLLQVSSNLW